MILVLLIQPPPPIDSDPANEGAHTIANTIVCQTLLAYTRGEGVCVLF